MPEKKPPFKVNDWWNPITDDRGEVWWNGDDAYVLYMNGEKEMTCPVYLDVGWSETHAHLVAVGEACHWGYLKTMKCEWKDTLMMGR